MEHDQTSCTPLEHGRDFVNYLTDINKQIHESEQNSQRETYNELLKVREILLVSSLRFSNLKSLNALKSDENRRRADRQSALDSFASWQSIVDSGIADQSWGDDE